MRQYVHWPAQGSRETSRLTHGAEFAEVTCKVIRTAIYDDISFVSGGEEITLNVSYNV